MTNIDLDFDNLIPGALLPHALALIPSFQTAIQIMSPFDDTAWNVLKPRLLAQRKDVQRGQDKRQETSAHATQFLLRWAYGQATYPNNTKVLTHCNEATGTLRQLTVAASGKTLAHSFWLSLYLRARLIRSYKRGSVLVPSIAALHYSCAARAAELYTNSIYCTHSWSVPTRHHFRPSHVILACGRASVERS
ncbi:hypothetical protein F4777DRAFT_148858 [Nemania sp. FL0916]|nr:hypothetical protein F4777DRAFT_148858 [Nemania sp. FL0916]